MHASTRSFRGPRATSGPDWTHGRRCRFVQRRAALAWPPVVPVGYRGRRRLGKHAAWCRSCGVANFVVHQVGPSCGSSELVKAHTCCRGRPSCRNTLHSGAHRGRTRPGRWDRGSSRLPSPGALGVVGTAQAGPGQHRLACGEPTARHVPRPPWGRSPSSQHPVRVPWRQRKAHAGASRPGVGGRRAAGEAVTLLREIRAAGLGASGARRWPSRAEPARAAEARRCATVLT